MDLNLRKAIRSNIAGNNEEELEATILDAIESGEEKMLPGLGVLFEMIWQSAEDTEKEQMLNILEQEAQKL
ncbi:small acid-soluble spore protein SspI [Aquisalibacillus elongatus]|uniref:Small, acid-soluble spore protein I n=1 Tax=Aquisalibacillus elongatus TaxID=485577 RepID=A0A3N5C9Y2_9BACI|nr:small acid-soluble spore protein SspI [Aquisalibacillus elongatus]RPF55415.1 small acid-soluble spore protein I (minor) [Aquisalibacillus elongatus]